MISTSTHTVALAGILIILLGASLTAGAEVTGTAAGAEVTGADRLTVVLDADGSAVVATTMTYDLTDQETAMAFESLATDETEIAVLAASYEEGLAAVAETASTETGREMQVRNASATIDDHGDVGIVTLSATWTNLAATEEAHLVVTEPFTSGFEPDRQLVVTVPEGYEVASATPAPANDDGGSLTWTAGTSLDGYELVLIDEDGNAHGTDAPADQSQAKTQADGPSLVIVSVSILLGLVVSRIRSNR